MDILNAIIFAFFIDNNKCCVYINIAGRERPGLHRSRSATIPAKSCLFQKGGFMRTKGSIVKLVFGCIDEVVSTTENIHRSIIENKAGTAPCGFQKGGKRKHVYDTIKTVNGKVEELVSGFIK